jgi:TolB protein
MNRDGTDLARLPVEGGARSGVWSPGGSRIAFTSYRDDGDAEIYIMNADGTVQLRLTQSPGVDEMPSWSRDGARIVFATNRVGPPEIYVMDVNGTGQTNLTRNTHWDAMPAWRP